MKTWWRLTWIKIKRRWRDPGKIDIEPPSQWQSIFEQSRLYGGQPKLDTRDDVVPWHWPKDTFLQRRLEQKKAKIIACENSKFR